jgi:thiol-disulfide isomerase/thioredoxin
MQKKKINKYLSTELSYLDVRINNYNEEELFNTEFIPINTKEVIDNIDGKRFLFINFWATWCAPCVEELPFLEKLILDDSISILPITFILANNEKIKIQKKLSINQNQS